MRMRNLNSHRGIGLLELMLSIIVITAVILGATKYYLVAKEAMRITQAQEVVSNVGAAAYKWVEGYANFSKFPTQKDEIGTLVTAGLLPGKYNQPGISPWGGKLITSSDADALRVGFAGLPTKACAILKAKYGKCVAGDTSATCLDDNCTFYFWSP